MSDTAFAGALALALAYAGMALLCLAMDRHHQQVWGREPSRRQRLGLQGGGSVLLALALLPCVAAWSATVGVVLWLGFLSAGVLPLVFLLPYAPRATVCSALLLAPLALAGLTSLL
ncbi:DUF3325 domain-containing protein [Massilia atriviolacea]|uniref:DUF3325 domain-containing protein n=1 Tax=Massilia atriviolacea TaxID=2495579 RepID=A0A430HCN9_9BURK|nr:DUF3325 domain-containing protein [Massilia atriviolacea]RSZ55267.1 DUF3325 domain-containing protein [Massilia atriviolacea]